MGPTSLPSSLDSLYASILSVLRFTHLLCRIFPQDFVVEGDILEVFTVIA